MPGMLYYPTINPSSQVLTQAVLYWDFISTVVPPDFDHEYLDRGLRQITDAGLYRPIIASQSFLEPDLLDLAISYLVYLSEAIPTEELVPPHPESHFELLKLPRHQWERTLFRPPKFHLEVGDELMRRGLAHRDPDSNDLLWISSAVQTSLFSVVVREIAWQRWEEGGCTAGDALYPYTDSPEADRMATEHWEKGWGRSQPRKRSAGLGRSRYVYPETFAPCWNIEIGGLLPVPREDVLLGDLISFRSRYNNERVRLIQTIDRMLHELQRNYDHPKDVFRAMEKDLESALADFEAAGRGIRISWVRRSVAATVAVSSAFAGLRFAPESAWLLGVVSGIAVNVLTDSVRKIRRRPTVDISYLSRVNRALTP